MAKPEPGILAINAKGHPVLLSKRLWEELGREFIPGNRTQSKQTLYKRLGEGFSADLNKLIAKHRDEEDDGETAAKATKAAK